MADTKPFKPATANTMAPLGKHSMVLPRRMQRCLLIYTICVMIVLALLNLDIVGNPLESISLWQEEATPPTTTPLRGSTFPLKIWQTWKIDPLLFGITETVRATTWLQKNPNMRYEVITDASDMTYIEQHFGPGALNRPDIVGFYRSVKVPIIKADLLRYLILYAEGGVYSDIDVEALKPFHRFFPDTHDEQSYDLVVGIEVDEPHFKEHPILGPKSQSFCQWTIIARPGHPVFLRLVENIMKWLSGIARKQHVSIGDVELDFDQVITGTGPSAFTKAVMAEMNRVRPKGSPTITWDTFHNMYESKVVSRVLVLPVEAFCAGQGHSDSGNHGSRGALVKHHYHASNWPNRHHRYNHPAYGQVEECNWNVECVQQWDKDIADFEKLSKEAKDKKVKERLELIKKS